jgi:hypothetical protein
VAPFDSEGMSRQKSATHAAILVWFMALACGAALAACDRGSEASVRRVIEDHDQLLRDGDGEGYWSLFSRRARQEAGLVGPEALLRLTLVARPERVRTVQGVLVRAHTAAVFTRFVDAGQTHYGADRLVRESGEWRIDRQVVSTTPFTAAYFLPPEGGRFMGAGAPWDRVAPITDPEVGRPDQPKASWQLARDEAFVYLRASYAKELPPVGERLEGGATSLDLLGFGPASIEAVITRPLQKPTRVSITFEATAKRGGQVPARAHPRGHPGLHGHGRAPRGGQLDRVAPRPGRRRPEPLRAARERLPGEAAAGSARGWPRCQRVPGVWPFRPPHQAHVPLVLSDPG